MIKPVVDSILKRIFLARNMPVMLDVAFECG